MAILWPVAIANVLYRTIVKSEDNLHFRPYLAVILSYSLVNCRVYVLGGWDI